MDDITKRQQKFLELQNFSTIWDQMEGDYTPSLFNLRRGVLVIEPTHKKEIQRLLRAYLLVVVVVVGNSEF